MNHHSPFLTIIFLCFPLGNHPFSHGFSQASKQKFSPSARIIPPWCPSSRSSDLVIFNGIIPWGFCMKQKVIWCVKMAVDFFQWLDKWEIQWDYQWLLIGCWKFLMGVWLLIAMGLISMGDSMGYSNVVSKMRRVGKNNLGSHFF